MAALNGSLQAWALFGVGLTLCFFGWHLFRFSARVIGFVFGASLGFSLARTGIEILNLNMNPNLEPWLVLAVTLLLGILGLYLVRMAVKFVLFAAGLFLGLMLGAEIQAGGLSSLTSSTEIWLILGQVTIWSLVLGLGLGVLFVFFEKGFVIIFTATVGAYTTVIQFGVSPLIFLVVALVGMAVQFWLSRGARVHNLRLVDQPNEFPV